MKLIFYLLILFFLTSPIVMAQEKSFELIINGGFSFPTTPNNFTDYWDNGYNIGVGVGYRFKPQITAIAFLLYNDFPINKNSIYSELGLSESDVNIQEGSINSIGLTANLKFNLTEYKSVISPFIQLGIGYYRFSSEASLSISANDEVITFGDSRGALIWSIGVGSDFNVNERISLFLYTDYRIGYSDNVQLNYLPIAVGVIFNL